MNEIIGGWQVSGLMSYHSGTPLTVSDAGDYNVNYDVSAYGILAPGATLPSNGFQFDSRGIPSIFANPNAVNSFVGAGPGVVGTRGIVRGPHFFNTDLAVSKAFRLPWEHQSVSFRAEAFNLFNNVEFGVPQSESGHTNHLWSNYVVCFWRSSPRPADGAALILTIGVLPRRTSALFRPDLERGPGFFANPFSSDAYSHARSNF